MISAPVELDQRDSSVAKAIREVQRAAYAVEAELTGFDAIPPLRESAEVVRTLDLVFLGMHERTRLVALAGYMRNGDTVDIDRVAVHPDYFRRGFASRLLTTIHRYEEDASTFTVSTGRANTPAIALYERLGYVIRAHEHLPEGIEITRLTRTT